MLTNFSNVGRKALVLLTLGLFVVWFGGAKAGATTYTASLATSGDVSLSVAASGSGANVGLDKVTVNSTCPAGYTLMIAGPSDASLYLDGDTSSTEKIVVTPGTVENPRQIIGDGNLNTWGYSIYSSTINGNFIGISDTLTEVVSKGSASAGSGDVVPVYYGASVSLDRTPGLYKMAEAGAINYYLVTSLDCTSYQVAFNANGGSGVMPNQRISEGALTALDANAFVAPDNKVFVGWNTAADGSGMDYADRAEVTDIAAVGQTVTLYAQWAVAWEPDCTPGKICYDDNGAASVTTMGEQTVTSNSEVTLWASNYQRSGYGFAGWNTLADGSGTKYGPNQTITTGDLSTEGMRLFAMWIEAEKTDVVDEQTGDHMAVAVTLQEWNGCANLAIGQVTALTDERDREVYAVAKLADNRCWMIENLRLGSDVELSTLNTNAPSLPLTNDSANPVATSNYLSASTTSGWCTEKSAVCYEQSKLNASNTLDPVQEMTSPTQNVYSYGNYYNWYSATAGTGTYSLSFGSGNAAGSICPVGWGLPTGGLDSSSSDFYSYGVAVMGEPPITMAAPAAPGYSDSVAFRAYPNNIVFAGEASGNATTRGSYFGLQSSTGSDSGGNFGFGGNGMVYPGTGGSESYIGYSVRCIKK